MRPSRCNKTGRGSVEFSPRKDDTLREKDFASETSIRNPVLSDRTAHCPFEGAPRSLSSPARSLPFPRDPRIGWAHRSAPVRRWATLTLRPSIWRESPGNCHRSGNPWLAVWAARADGAVITTSETKKPATVCTSSVQMPKKEKCGSNHGQMRGALGPLEIRPSVGIPAGGLSGQMRRHSTKAERKDSLHHFRHICTCSPLPRGLACSRSSPLCL